MHISFGDYRSKYLLPTSSYTPKVKRKQGSGPYHNSTSLIVLALKKLIASPMLWHISITLFHILAPLPTTQIAKDRYSSILSTPQNQLRFDSLALVESLTKNQFLRLRLVLKIDTFLADLFMQATLETSWHLKSWPNQRLPPQLKKINEKVRVPALNKIWYFTQDNQNTSVATQSRELRHSHTLKAWTMISGTGLITFATQLWHLVLSRQDIVNHLAVVFLFAFHSFQSHKNDLKNN